jgi:integrase
MPRRSKGPRLYLDPSELVYVIRDGTRKRRTGCGEAERASAEIALSRYIADKYEPVRESRPDRVLVSDTLTFYSREVAPKHRSSATTGYSVDRLLDWWKERPLSEVKTSTCREYVEHRMNQTLPQAKRGDALKRRVSSDTARRELGVLRAAINAYHAEHQLDALPIVGLPEAAPSRDRWLTRDEAAKFLRALGKHPEKPARTALARFFLISVYTGTRSGVVRGLAWMPTTGAGWLDLDSGIMHRRAAGEGESKKRRPPLRIPPRLMGHLRRWRKLDGTRAHVIDHGFGPLGSQRRAWAWVKTKAGLGPEVTPHVLRHTAATWMMQGKADLWEAAGFLGMSPETLWRVYGHHHPDYQRSLAEKVGRKGVADSYPGS